MTAVLISHFLFNLRQSDRTAVVPSSPSAVPSLNIVEIVEEDPAGTLPAFIASMGSRVDIGLPFVDQMDTDGDMAHMNEGVSREEGLLEGDGTRLWA